MVLAFHRSILRSSSINGFHKAFSKASLFCTRPKRFLSVVVSTDTDEKDPSPFRQRVKVGKHVLVADEPLSFGGKDEGPSPYDLLMGALGSCTSITIKMYADRKNIPLDGVDIVLDHNKIYAKDCEECDDAMKGKNAKVDKFDRVITLHGKNLTEEDRKNLLRIANLCPVHKTLEASSIVTTTLKERTECENMEQLVHIPGRASTLPGNFPVIRFLPHKNKRLVGPFCFLDHFGPVDVTNGTLDVGPHPHIGLCTLTYLFSGAILHRDSTGAEMVIMPGEVNLMISGKGAVHTERGSEVLDRIEPINGKKLLHGLQLWIALPKSEEQCEPSFHHASTEELPDLTSEMNPTGEISARLVAGSLLNKTVKNIPVLSPLFLVDVIAKAGSSVEFPIEPGHEAAIYVAEGQLLAGAEETRLDLGEGTVYVSDSSRNMLVVKAKEDSRFTIFGGMPFPKKREILWNFVSSDQGLIKSAVHDWEKVIKDPETSFRSRFPEVFNETNDDPIPMATRFMQKV